MSGAVSITLFVLSLIAAIMLHELGHLLTARRYGMRADQYFLGFGPTLWSTRRGETEYGVKAFPLGGFVRIKGMSPLDERLAPVGTRELFAPAAVPGQASAGPDEQAWARVRAELLRRGTPSDEADELLATARARAGDRGDPQAALRALHTAVAERTPDTGQVGDLHHRLLRGDENRFFHDRPAWQRAVVLVAGSLTHFLIALVVLVAMYALLPLPTGEVGPEVAQVVPDSPAAAAGLEPGDRLLAVDQFASEDYDELRLAIRARPDRPVVLSLERDGERITLTVVPERTEDPDTGETIGLIGMVPAEELERLGPVEALEAATVGPGGFVAIFTGSIAALVRVFSPQGLAAMLSQATGAEERGLDGAVSLVGAASLAGQSTDTGFAVLILLSLIASINIFIGIFNLVPLPPLDGGHLAVLAVERSVNLVRALRGRPTDFTVDPRAIAAVAIPVLVVLGTVFLVLLYLDITDPIRLF